jgi:hypothetical protein|tara:strand:- start:20 stop:184 length:165 start_codon:yes stop_codon:yes gene_type:complete
LIFVFLWGKTLLTLAKTILFYNNIGAKMDFWQWILGYFIIEWIEEQREIDQDDT